jgi:hypothetical protein
MKKSVIIFLTTFLLHTNTNGQITLDTIVYPLRYIGYDFKIVEISQGETKYFWADTLANTFNLYNMDWTTFISNISVPIPFNYSGIEMTYQCLYLSRTLFELRRD